LKPQQCLFLVPESDRLPQLQELRLRYDPLAQLLPPHITVVFPFDAALYGGALRSLLERQRPPLPMPFALGQPQVKGDCLYFPLGVGREAVLALTKGLYAELPASLALEDTHVPHVTFGRLETGQDAAATIRAAEAIIPLAGVCRRLILERIGANGESHPELELGVDEA
jgi:2'-5' RNA ligase